LFFEKIYIYINACNNVRWLCISLDRRYFDCFDDFFLLTLTAAHLVFKHKNDKKRRRKTKEVGNN